MFTLLFNLYLISFIGAEIVRYDNYSLYKVHPENEEHLKYLKNLRENNDDLDFWRPPTVVGDYVSVVSPPELKNRFEHSLKKRGIAAELMVKNIQDAFDDQIISRRRRDVSRQLYWNGYQTLQDINEWFQLLAETHSDIVSVISLDQTYEGRNITGIKISRSSGKKSVVLEGGEIGADWLSPVVLTYIVDQLVNGEDPEALQYSQDFDWHIFPVTNPDGFEYSQNSVRLWTKNRRPITQTAVGVDLTKNWNSQWGVYGGSFYPTDENYIGLGPFSEIETRTLSYYIEDIGRENLAVLLNFRAFGQRLVIPFAHTTDPMYNYDDMIKIGRRALGSLSVRYNTQYLADTSLVVSDGATGSIADWVKYRFNPPVVATYLLRDTGAWGFTLPITQVEPSCQETFDSVMAIIREAKFTNMI